jgi:hypothetical protein
MVQIPGMAPTPPPEQPEPEHHDHYLPDELWAKVVRDAQACRAESEEDECAFEECDFDESELD